MNLSINTLKYGIDEASLQTALFYTCTGCDKKHIVPLPNAGERVEWECECGGLVEVCND